MNVFKMASAGQRANVGPPKQWWRRVDSFSAFLNIAFLSCCLLFTGLAQAADPVDCEQSWFGEETDGKSANDLVQAYKKLEIFKDGNVCYKETRADFIYILVTALDKKLNERFSYSGSINSHFADVNSGVMHYDQIRMAEETGASSLGIIDLGNDNFRPTEYISRIEALAFTVRTYEKFCELISAGTSPFSDRTDTNIDPIMYQYMDKGFAEDLASGYLIDGQREFRPNNEVPRHESVAFIDNVISKIDSCPKTKFVGNVTGINSSYSIGNNVSYTITGEDSKELDYFTFNISRLFTNGSDGGFIPFTDEIFRSPGEHNIYAELDYSKEINNIGGKSINPPFKGIFSTSNKTAGKYQYDLVIYNIEGSTVKDTGMFDLYDVSSGSCDNNICQLQINISGINTDKVERSISGNSCGIDCYSYDEGKSITLTANPSSTFQKWQGGDCNGSTSPSCNLTMNSDQSITAIFREVVNGNGPDYKVTAMELSPNQSEFKVGEDFRIYGKTKNIGDEQGGKLVLNWRISQNGPIDSPNDGELFHEDSWGRLDSGQEVELNSNSFTVPQHSGDYWLGLCVEMESGVEVSTSNNCNSIKITVGQPPIETVSLTISVPSNGKVTSNDFNCGNGATTCKKEYDKDNVPSITLIAVPDSGYNFTGWGGACSGIGNCSPSVGSNTFVTANFDAIPEYHLNVIIDKLGEGKGTVSGNSGSPYQEGTSVTLTAQESPGSTFMGWSDSSCSGSSCTVTMNGPKNITATFKNDKPVLTLSPPPANNAEGLELDFTVNWTATDDKQSELEQTVRFWKEEDESTVVDLDCPIANDGTVTCSPSALGQEVDYNTWYVLEVTATDKGNASIQEKWRFETIANKAPNPPTSLAPCDIEVQDWLNDDLKLTWNIPDPADLEGDAVTYLVYFNWNIVSEEVSCNTNSCSVTIPTNKLTFGKSYDWHIFPTDAYNGRNSARDNISENCSFTTHKNTAPERVTNPSPAHAATEIDHKVDLALSWDASTDVDGDSILYSVYFGTNIDPQPIASCQEQVELTCIIPAEQLEEGIVYSWWVIATDGINNPVSGTPWGFQTQTNQPPEKVTSPIIRQGDINANPILEEVIVDADASVFFSWQDSTDNEEEDVTYEFCYHQQGNAGQLCFEVAQNSFEMRNGLIHGSAYDYRVIAKDSNGNEAEYDTWHFETQESAIGYPLTTYSGLYNIFTRLEDSSNNPDVVKYHLLRVERNGANPEDLEFNNPADIVTDTPILRPNLHYIDDNFEDINRGTEYCYQAISLNEANKEVDKSSISCSIFGRVVLETKRSGGLKNTTEDVPIYIQNSNGLKIGDSDIMLRYDKNIIEAIELTGNSICDDNSVAVEVKKGAILDGDVDYDVTACLDSSDFQFNTLTISIRTGEDAEAEELYDIGVFVNIPFNVIGNDGEDTKLELLQSDDPTLDENSYITDDDFIHEISNEYLIVKSSYFGVGEAYIKGDLNGNAVKQSADSRLAQFIGVDKVEATPEQEIAGDVNGDEIVDSGDAGMILSRVLNKKWPSLPSAEKLVAEQDSIPTTRRRQTRDGNDDHPTIIFSLGEISGTLGSELTLPLFVHNVSDLTATNLAIVYDTNVIAEIVKVKRFGLTADASLSSFAKNGILRIGMHSTTPINGSGEFALITFRLVSEGSVKSSVLSIAQARLYDVIGRNFATSVLQRNIEAEHGKVTIIDVSEIPDEPIDWEVSPYDDEPIPERTGIPFYSISGTARDNDGPIEDMIISTDVVSTNDKVTETNQYGDYQILGLVYGEYEVKAKKRPYFMENNCVVGNGDNCQLDFIVDFGDEEATYPIYGAIVDYDGLPVDGVTVKACGNITQTDKTGFYVFLDLPAGECDIVVKKGSDILGEDSCDLGETSNCQLNIVVPSLDQPTIDDSYGVQIRVKDKQKQPIADVTIQIGDVTITTDENGYAETDGFLEGKYRLTASKDGFEFLPRDFELGNKQLWTEIFIKPVTALELNIIPTTNQKAEQGKSFGYKIMVVNDGEETATDVVLEYELPGGTELVEVTDRDQSCRADDYMVTCDLPDLVPGASYKVQVELKVLRQANFENIVSLNSNEYTVSVAKRTTIVKPYLSVFCKATPSPIKVLGTLSYECDIELNNNAPVQVAAGNKLVVNLPNGMKFKSSPDNCEADELVVTCYPDDLSIVNPNNSSSTTISMNAILEDPGLIKLVTKAEIMADNQSNHSSKVSTEIKIDNTIKVDGVILLDLTSSMEPQWEAIISEIKQRLVDEFANGAKPFIALVTFRDYDDIKFVTATRNLEVLLDKLEKLKTSGGGMCPEASAEAFELALDHINSNGTIMLITDAPYYDDPQTLAIVENIKEAIVDKNINYFPIISSHDCSDADSLNNIID